VAGLNALRPAAALLRARTGFAAVMATGITSVAGAELDLAALSWAFAGVAFALFAGLVAAVARRPRPVVGGVETFAAVAATAVLGTRLALAHELLAARVFLAAAALVWIGTWVEVARARRLGPATGTRLLAVVSTQSLAILVAVTAGLPTPLALALLALGVALYAALIPSVPLSELRHGAGDVWITMGALAISALAAAHVTVDAGGHALRVLTFALWIAATCWLPALLARELLRHRLQFEPKRWSTVFPLGMYSAASTAAGHVVGFDDLALGRAFLVLAALAWAVTAFGAVRPALAVLARGR
jgi:hypothetical protein